MTTTDAAYLLIAADDEGKQGGDGDDGVNGGGHMVGFFVRPLSRLQGRKRNPILREALQRAGEEFFHVDNPDPSGGALGDSIVNVADELRDEGESVVASAGTAAGEAEPEEMTEAPRSSRELWCWLVSPRVKLGPGMSTWSAPLMVQR
ncbi:unnamed protein product [Linum trigynum]|uniref:Uncharacterized protein n=1 Tax=Linum trigynum TaxID=586398 RepID=A0AAV2FVI3_9ROSI